MRARAWGIQPWYSWCCILVQIEMYPQKPLKTTKNSPFWQKFKNFTGLTSEWRVKSARKSLGNSTRVLLMLYLGPLRNVPPKKHQKPPKMALFGPKFIFFTFWMCMFRVINVRKSLGNTTLVRPLLHYGPFANKPPQKTFFCQKQPFLIPNSRASLV